MIMLYIFYIIFFTIINQAYAFSIHHHRPVKFVPKSYAALGDSYAAGIGAGTFTRGSIDGRDNPCARTNGAYPFVLAKSLGLLEKESQGNLTGWTDFYACSGDELHNLDAQIKQMKGKRVDLITLSISGNDFLFGDVVKACVFPWGFESLEYYARVCTEKLAASAAAIGNGTFWDNFSAEVKSITTNQLTKNGKLVITGYPKFFAPEAKYSDACAETFFLDNRLGRKLKMKLDTRKEINRNVDEVNRRIQAGVVEKLKKKGVSFINVDALYEGHRFCEPSKGMNAKGSDPQDDTVWFNDIKSELEEITKWNKPASHKEEDEGTPHDKMYQETNGQNVLAKVDDVVGDERPEVESDNTGDLFSGILDKFRPSNWQIFSVFHPKRQAGVAVAAKIYESLLAP